MYNPIRIDHGHDDKLKLLQKFLLHFSSLSCQQFDQILRNERASSLTGMLPGDDEDDLVRGMFGYLDGRDDIVGNRVADALDLYVPRWESEYALRC
jgi:hypothetical protein